MNYPVWDIPVFGTSLLIASVAIIHVYVSHLAIGGGLFLVITEALGHRENNPSILEYVKKAAVFFLLISMVFGAVTGVGIWFTISTIHPAATSVLIHNFVFGWATEWVFFLGEIVALFVYVYTFGKLSPRDHMRVGFIYFAFAWLSLFVINAIVSFMLTPGEWINDGSFWSGFFNPSMWPSLVFRSLLCAMIAGLFGFFTAARLNDQNLATRLLRYSARWMIAPLVLMAPAGYWYLAAIPATPRALIEGNSPEMPTLIYVLAISVPILLIGGMTMIVRLPGGLRRSISVLLVLVGLAYMGSFEWIREAARRPWIIPGYMYSNGLMPKQVEEASVKGILPMANWVRTHDVKGDNATGAGREIFRLECQTCHTTGGIKNDIIPLTEGYSLAFMDGKIAGIGAGGYMPPFAGTPGERLALAKYIVADLHGKDTKIAIPKTKFSDEALAKLSLDALADKHIMFAWRDGFQIKHQIIKRGESPVIVLDGVKATETSVPDHPGFVKLEAISKQDKVLASAIVAPPNNDFGCVNCHGSVLGIRQVHDRIEKTDLADNTSIPFPQDCSGCHDNLFEVVHKRHASFFKNGDAAACANCHKGPGGTSFLIGHHAVAGLDCVSCHGTIGNDKRGGLVTRPDCLYCHVDFGAPQKDDYFGGANIDKKNSFGRGTDDAGMRCVSCHGGAHSIGNTPIGKNGNCAICHGVKMQDSIHHKGIELTVEANENADAGKDLKR